MPQRTIDLVLAVLATVVAFVLSWPFWRAFDYWAESAVAWWVYFAVGVVLGIYVFYVFLRSLRALAAHDAHGGDADEEGRR